MCIRQAGAGFVGMLLALSARACDGGGEPPRIEPVTLGSLVLGRQHLPDEYAVVDEGPENTATPGSLGPIADYARTFRAQGVNSSEFVVQLQLFDETSQAEFFFSIFAASVAEGEDEEGTLHTQFDVPDLGDESFGSLNDYPSARFPEDDTWIVFRRGTILALLIFNGVDESVISERVNIAEKQEELLDKANP